MPENSDRVRNKVVRTDRTSDPDLLNKRGQQKASAAELPPRPETPPPPPPPSSGAQGSSTSE